MAIPLVAALWTAFAAVALPLVVKVLVGLGFAAVTYVGVSALLDSVVAQITSNLSGASASIITILAMARVDDAIAVIVSAMGAKLILNGLTAAGAFTKLQFKGTGG